MNILNSPRIFKKSVDFWENQWIKKYPYKSKYNTPPLLSLWDAKAMTDVAIWNPNLDRPAKRLVEEVAKDDESKGPKPAKRPRGESDEQGMVFRFPT